MMKLNGSDYKVLSSFVEEFWFLPSDALSRTLEAIIWEKVKLVSPILEIGCGDGRHSNLLFRNGLIDVGLDIDGKQVARARKYKLYKKVICADAEKLPFKKNRFACVICNSTMEHIKNDLKALKEIFRVLKPNGKFMFSVPNSVFENLFEKNGVSRNEMNILNTRLGHVHYRSDSMWENKLAESGFSLTNKLNFFSDETAKVWYPLFRLMTTKLRGKEVWSYLDDSLISKFLPKDLIGCLLKKYLWKTVKKSYGKNGGKTFFEVTKPK